MRERSVPELDARAAAAGLALSVLVATGAYFLGFAAIGAWAGALAGGYVGGRMAGRDGLFHGAVVGAADVVVLAIVSTAGSATASNVVVDTAATILSDALLLVLASIGGRLATRS